MRSLRHTLSLSTSAFAVGLATLAASPAAAQAPPAEEAGAVEEIVVTGTSIRGVAPVGANLVSVGREAIESTGAVNV